MKKKVILSSVLSIVLCLSLICGATFALFTDTDTVNVAVTSGKVSMTATVDPDSIRVASLEDADWKAEGVTTFTNGGSVTFTDNKISFDRITPGDRMQFQITVTNYSNVKILYRTMLRMLSGSELFKALTVKIDGEDFSGATRLSNWTALDAAPENGESVATVTVYIELPEDKGNDYQDLTTEMAYSVEAVQGNANVSSDPLDTVYIYTVTDLALFRDSVRAGTSYSGRLIKMMDDIDLNNEKWTPIGRMINTGGKDENSTFYGTFDGNGHTISNLYVDTVDDVSDTNMGAGLFGAANGTIKNLTVVNATVKTAHWAGVIVGSIEGSIENCHVENATITCLTEQVLENGALVWDNGDKAGAIAGYATNGSISGCSVKKATITAYRDMGAIVGCAYNNVTGNTVSEVTLIKDNTNDYKGTADDATVDAYVGTVYGTPDNSGNTGDVTIRETVSTVVTTSAELESALTSDETEITVSLSDTVSFDIGAWNSSAMGGSSTETIVINGNGNTLVLDETNSDWNHVTTNGAKLILNNVVIEKGVDKGNTAWNSYILQFACEVEMNNVTVRHPIGVKGGAELNNVSIDFESGDYYALYVTANGQSVTVNGLTVDAARGIKVIDEYLNENVAKVTLNVSDADFNTTGTKAAILVTSTKGADITLSNVDIADVAADPIHEVWVDKDRADYVDLVTVTGGSKIVEEGEGTVTKVSSGLYKNEDGTYYATSAEGVNALNQMLVKKTDGYRTVKAIELKADIDFSGYTWSTIVLHQDQAYDISTINGNGYTISNLTTTNGAMFSLVSHYSVLTIKNLTISGAKVSGGYHVGVIVGQAATSVTFDNVHVVDSEVTGTCNVGGIIGATGEFGSAITVTFNNCSVENTILTATSATEDPTGASGFLGRLVTLDTTTSYVVFTGVNTVEGNTISNPDGIAGGDVYGYTIYDSSVESNWRGTGSCNTFTNWNGIQ